MQLIVTTKQYISNMKSLKISKGQSESVYRRRTDNTMARPVRFWNDIHHVSS